MRSRERSAQHKCPCPCIEAVTSRPRRPVVPSVWGCSLFNVDTTMIMIRFIHWVCDASVRSTSYRTVQLTHPLRPIPGCRRCPGWFRRPAQQRPSLPATAVLPGVCRRLQIRDGYLSPSLWPRPSLSWLLSGRLRPASPALLAVPGPARGRDTTLMHGVS